MADGINAALEAVEEIVVAKPELTSDEWEVVHKAEPYIKSILKPTLLLELEEKYKIKEAEFQSTLIEQNKASVKEYMEAWKKEQEPLSPKDIGDLLSQEYVEYTFEIATRGKWLGACEIGKKKFVVCELPADAELRFVDIAKKNLIPMMEKINAADFRLNDSMTESLKALIMKVPEVKAVACDLVAVCLDPWKEDASINSEWVGKNLSAHRIFAVLLAQAEANRYRDFFLNGSQLYLRLKK